MLPEDVNAPPKNIAPLIPTPPVTTKAPVVVFELTVPELATKLPATISIPDTISEVVLI